MTRHEIEEEIKTHLEAIRGIVKDHMPEVSVLNMAICPHHSWAFAFDDSEEKNYVIDVIADGFKPEETDNGNNDT